MQAPFKPIDFLSRDIRRREARRRHDPAAVEPHAEALRKARAGVPGQVGERGARSRVAGAAPRAGPRLAEGHLCRGQAAGRCGDPGAARPRLRAGQAGDDPVVELDRVRAAHHGGHAGARAARAGVAGLFGDEPGPRQAALRLRPRSSPAWCSCRTARSTPARWRRSTSRACCWSMSTRRRRRCSRCRGASSWPPGRPMPWRDRSTASSRKTVGKFLFTSGSTGMPKAVINTQEMMCANLAMGQMARTRKPDDPSPVHARLAAVEPHDGRQRHLPGQSRRRRHDLHRRRQAVARPVRGDAAQSARDLADLLCQRAGRLRHAGDGAGEGRGAGQDASSRT